ncbi:PDZ domain-containing protein [Streptomyces cinereospinus]|uniref:PDZ domain-containing protein n=1 Tax=Streptomyces cinereospinus TaxID=285561 RepID=A0ABV5MZK5_9ACTN
MRRPMTACTVLALGASLLAGGTVPAATAAAKSGRTAAVRAVTPQSNVPGLDAPGPARPVDFPPDRQVHDPGRITVQAPQYTRITQVDPRCRGLACPVSIAADGSSATLDLQSRYHWIWPWTVYVAANDDAPLAGGRFSGSLTAEGVTVPLDVDITPGTPGAFGGYAGNAPGGGGARVRFVDPDVHAAAAGFMVNDIVTAVDGQPVTSPASLNAALAGRRAGATVPVDIRRGGTPMTLRYTIDQ